MVISICSVEKIEGRPAHGTQAQNNLPSSARWPNSLVSPHLCAVQLPEEFSVLPCAPACLPALLSCSREREERKKNPPPPRESGGPEDGGRLREACAAHRRWRRRVPGDRLYSRQARLQVAATTPRPRAWRRMRLGSDSG